MHKKVYDVKMNRPSLSGTSEDCIAALVYFGCTESTLGNQRRAPLPIPRGVLKGGKGRKKLPPVFMCLLRIDVGWRFNNGRCRLTDGGWRLTVGSWCLSTAVGSQPTAVGGQPTTGGG